MTREEIEACRDYAVTAMQIFAQDRCVGAEERASAEDEIAQVEKLCDQALLALDIVEAARELFRFEHPMGALNPFDYRQLADALDAWEES